MPYRFLLLLALAAPGAWAQTASPPAPSPAQGLGSPPPTYSPDTTSPETDAALHAMNQWLGLLDQGRYDACWDATSTPLRAPPPADKAAWTQALRSARDPLGFPLARAIARLDVTYAAPGLPGGKYLVVDFASSFEKAPMTREIITVSLDPDAVWRVTRYQAQAVADN